MRDLRRDAFALDYPVDRSLAKEPCLRVVKGRKMLEMPQRQSRWCRKAKHRGALADLVSTLDGLLGSSFPTHFLAADAPMGV